MNSPWSAKSRSNLGRSLAHLAGVAFNPYLMAIAAMVAALQLLQERWKKLQEAMVETIGRMQSTGNTAIEAHINAVMGAAAANTEFRLSLIHSRDAMDVESRAAERRIELYHATVEAQNRVFSAQHQAIDASISAAEATGQITALQALDQRQQVDLAEKKLQFDRENLDAQNEINEKKRRLAEAPARLEQAKAAHDEAVAQAAPGNEAIEGIEQELNTRRKQRDEMQKAAADAQAGKLNPITVASGVFSNAIGGFNAQEQSDFFKKQAENAEADVARIMEKLKAKQNQMMPVNANIEKAKKEADIEQEILNTYGAQAYMLEEKNRIRKQGQTQEISAVEAEYEARKKQAKAEAVKYEAGRLNTGTSIEKEGFRFSGSQAPTFASQHAMQTAQATQTTAQVVTQILALLKSGRATPDAVGRLLQNQLP
jgi:hypothetical protein